MALSNEEREGILTIFTDVMSNFRKSLTEEEQKDFQEFSTADDMIKSVKELAEKHPSMTQGPVQRFCQSVLFLSSSLKPYFAVINSFVQSDPHVAGLVWGSIQLVFQLCSNYSTFFEKLSEIFSTIAEELQVFETQTLGLVTRAKDRIQSPSYPRLIRTLAYLYTDVIDFCHHLCDLFSTKRTKLRKRAKLLGELLWKPFDDRFSEYMDRLKKHKRLFKLELNAASMGELMQSYDALEQEMSQGKLFAQQQMTQLDRIEKEFTAAKLGRIKAWIGPPPWQACFEEAKHKRSPNTGTWILRHPIYRAWRHEKLDSALERLDSDPLSKIEPCQILSIQAKPGYGKTILCATILEDISFCLLPESASTKTELSPSPRDHSVGFYFFDKQRIDTSYPGSAFRAIVAQLIHAHQLDHKVIDLALLLMERKGSGQLAASDDEVQCLLAIYLQKIPNITLVFDGVDECSDSDTFLQTVGEIAAKSACKMLLSSRPTITTDSYKSIKVSTILLEELANYQDIEKYLRPEIQQLYDNEKLIEDEPVHVTVTQIAQRSRSMFLWANLLIKYLKSDMMTPEDRHEAITELNLLEELDTLYAKIIQQLRKQSPGKRGWTNVQRLFQWVTVSARPLHVEELRVALAIQAGESTTKRRYITKFEETVIKMSGALIEIAEDRTFRFIHLSVVEFLTQTKSDTGSNEYTDGLRIDLEEVNCLVAMDCISYLLCDTLKEPLSGSSRNKPNSRQVMKTFPLLLYSAQFWPHHVYMALETWLSEPRVLKNSRVKLASLLSKFLLHKPTVTVWTEASWLFGSPPSLAILSERAEILAKAAALPSCEILTSFSHDLDRLNQYWGKLLCEAPNEIWEPSVPAFMSSPFWVGTDVAKVSLINEESGHERSVMKESQGEALLIASQTSVNGLEVGTIKAWPSRVFNEAMNNASIEELVPQQAHFYSCGWKANYTLNNVLEKRQIFNLSIDIPPEEVCIILRQAFLSRTPKRFRFPVAFSADLRQISILGCVFRTLPVTCSTTEPSCYLSQKIEPPSRDEGTNVSLVVYPNEERREPCSFLPTNDWYQISFSPDGRYLVALYGEEKPGRKKFYGQWDIVMYHDHGEINGAPDFQELAQEKTTFCATASRVFVFHPSEPVLAMSRLGVTSLWFFAEKTPKLVNICKQPLSDLEFSHCGSYVHGTALEARMSGERVIINISAEINSIHRAISIQPARNGPAEDTTPRNALCKRENAVDQFSLLATKEVPNAMVSNTVVFSRNNGRGQISMLRQYHEEGAVVLQKLSEDGMAQEQCLTKLPKSSTLETSYSTLLASFQNSNSVHIVLNKAVQDSYSYEDVRDFELPVLVERQADSIPCWTGKRPGLELQDNEGKGKRKKLSG